MGSSSSLCKQGSKARKIVSLIEKIFCARLLKEKEIFAGFARYQAANRWVGLPPAGRQSVRVLLKMSSNFFQKTPSNKKTLFSFFCLVDRWGLEPQTPHQNEVRYGACSHTMPRTKILLFGPGGNRTHDLRIVPKLSASNHASSYNFAIPLSSPLFVEQAGLEPTTPTLQM